MRIWHEDLIPKLCQKHLCAMWREGLGCYKILTENKKGYRNHPAVKEFERNTVLLADRLQKVRIEMIKRGYHPKQLEFPFIITFCTTYEPWQTLDEQIKILKEKGCNCQI